MSQKSSPSRSRSKGKIEKLNQARKEAEKEDFQQDGIISRIFKSREIEA